MKFTAIITLMTELKKIKLTLLGEDIDHRHSLIAMLKGHCHSLGWVQDSHSMKQKGLPLGLLSRISRYFDQMTYTRDKNFLNSICQYLDQSCSNIVVAYWGTNPLSDIVAIKRLRPAVKIVLMVLCHPLALDNIGVLRQNLMMRRAAKWLDGILYPSKVMADYFHKNVFRAQFDRLPHLVLPPCWPMSYQCATNPPRGGNYANIIYVGRTDLSHHTVHVGDDLRPQMRAILDAGIELHHVRSPETSDEHPNRRPFSPLSQNDLIAKMAVYDASLISYNIDACNRPDRFELTIPDRLITSVAAGVPIAVPAKGYAGVKSYLHEYPAVFQFETAVDLKLQLDNRSRVESVRDRAWNARKNYAAESHGEALASFLTQFVS